MGGLGWKWSPVDVHVCAYKNMDTDAGRLLKGEDLGLRSHTPTQQKTQEIRRFVFNLTSSDACLHLTTNLRQGLGRGVGVS